MENKVSRVKDLAFNALIAALYVVLTLISFPISFMGLQFRVAEILCLLVFFNKKYIVGVALGCLIANLFSPIWPYDLLFGTFATLLSVLLISYIPILLINVFVPVIINGLVIGFELYWQVQANFITSMLLVMLGELVVLILGYIIIMIFKRNKTFYKIINAERNIDFKF